MEKEELHLLLSMHPHRLEALTDGICAFAMTLLVLSINLPNPKENIDVGLYLSSQLQNFWTFALSFLLLAFFWLNYSQQYHHIKKTDSVTVMINICILLFVVLMPGSTFLMNDYPNNKVAEIFFSGNFLILSFLMFLNWRYCLKKQFIDMTNRQHIALTTRRIFLLPTVPLMALLAAFIIPGWSTLVYLLIPVIMFFPRQSSLAAITNYSR